MDARASTRPMACTPEFLYRQNMEQVESSIGKALADFEREALPWFDSFRDGAYVSNPADPC